MTWRRGELWFDTEVTWFGERATAPAVAGFGAGSMTLPRLPSPPGLVASRLRRAAWKRRRDARRAKATAIALSPAVVFALAGLRGAGDPSSVLAEDPPSLTFRPSAVAAGALDRPVRVRTEGDTPGVAGGSPHPFTTKREHRAEAGPEVAPRIEWHHARSVGLPFSGSLIGGTQLPVRGLNWVTWDPTTDTVPNEPRRLYGNERTIRAIVSVAKAYRLAHPQAPRLVVGDISREGGGPFTDEHVSHQNGLDVDVYYPRLDRTLRAPTSADQIDHRLAQDLLDRFLAAGAQMIFVGFSTGLHGPGGVVIPWPYHDNHMHVRFPPPSG